MSFTGMISVFQLKSTDSNIGIKQLERSIIGLWQKDQICSVAVRILNGKVY